MLPGDLGILLHDGKPDEGWHVQDNLFHKFNNYTVSPSRLGKHICAAMDYLTWHSVGLLLAHGSPVAENYDLLQP